MKFITIVFILFTHFSFSQTVGFLGKKNVITINGVGSIPIIQNLFQGADSESPYYTYENGKLKSSKDFFNGGFVAGFSHAFSNKFGLGFDFETFFSNAAGPTIGRFYYTDPLYGDSYEQYLEFNHEALNLRTFTFIPKIEFQINNNQLPIGIVNQIGLGYSRTTVKDKVYNYEVVNNYEQYKEFIDNKKVFDQNQGYNGITFMYAFNVRVPLSKSLLFNYGLRYSFNYVFGALRDEGFIFGYDTDNNPNYLVSERKMKIDIGGAKFSNVITLNIGLSLVI